MTLDLTITLGNVLTIVGMAVASFVFLWSIRSQVAVINSEIRSFVGRLDKIDSAMTRLTEALIQLSRQEARLDAHADRLKSLEAERRA